MDDFAPAVGPQTMILPVQNGMKHVDILAQRFGTNHLWVAFARSQPSLTIRGGCSSSPSFRIWYMAK